jgi:hypothetical protein
MRGRRWAALVGSALTLIVLTGLAPRAMAGADPGWYASHSTEERQALVDYVYLRSGHAPPYSGLAATAAQDIADTIVASGTREFPLAPELAAEEFATVRKVGLFARLGEMAPTLFAEGAGLATIGPAAHHHVIFGGILTIDSRVLSLLGLSPERTTTRSLVAFVPCSGKIRTPRPMPLCGPASWKGSRLRARCNRNVRVEMKPSSRTSRSRGPLRAGAAR